MHLAREGNHGIEEGQKVTAFSEATISDEKRATRGEHYLLARTRLRIRDVIHHAKWRVLIVAGGAPSGEVNAIRELMPLAHITAVDKDESCLDAAIDCGVDEVVLCNLADNEVTASGTILPAPLRDLEKFDIVNIDLCAGANATTKKILINSQQLVAPRGIFLVTFSYGRDVAEVFKESLTKTMRAHSDLRETLEAIMHIAENDLIAGRLCYLFSHGKLATIRSVILYRGAQMPMCSIMFQSAKAYSPPSILKLGRGDFEILVTCPDSTRLYDCPQDRLEAIRRKHAAIKAAYTRSKSREPA